MFSKSYFLLILRSNYYIPYHNRDYSQRQSKTRIWVSDIGSGLAAKTDRQLYTLSTNRGRQCDIRVPTKWRLRLLSLRL